jgi:putative DNA primase/helicase
VTPPIDQFTDSAMAARVSREVLDSRFIYVHGIGWMEYNGHVWRECPPEAPTEAIREWCADRLVEAAQAQAAGTGTSEAVKGWVKWQAVTRVEAALRFCRGIVGKSPDDLDAHPDLLNCPNGVVDLRTGELKPSMPWYYFTKVTGCEYDPKAEHEDWTAALGCLPESVVTWLQIRYGQGITGHMTPDHRLVIQQGGGANGKSTLVTAVAGALGGYYLAATARLLLPAGKDANRPEEADLRGARFVAIEETPETGRLETQSLKTLIGTPTITARRLYQNYFTFNASHTMFLNTNYAPIVNETDHGTWRRLLLVVFPYTFTATPLDEAERQGDPGLTNRLRRDAQRQAVLAWLVAGATAWYEDGADETGRIAQIPTMVESDTNEWRGHTDHIAAFWDEYLVAAPGRCIAVTDMMRRYRDYLHDLGAATMAEGTFARRFKDHPITTQAKVYKSAVRMGPKNRDRFSRPHRDEWKTIPPLPDGMVKSWVDVAFRPEVDVPNTPVDTSATGENELLA